MLIYLHDDNVDLPYDASDPLGLITELRKVALPNGVKVLHWDSDPVALVVCRGDQLSEFVSNLTGTSPKDTTPLAPAPAG